MKGVIEGRVERLGPGVRQRAVDAVDGTEGAGLPASRVASSSRADPLGDTIGLRGADIQGRA